MSSNGRQIAIRCINGVSKESELQIWLKFLSSDVRKCIHHLKFKKINSGII